MNSVRYRIRTGQSYGEWTFVLLKYVQVTFKRSKRVGWRWMGLVKTAHDNERFSTREEALACARAMRKELVNR